MISVRITPQMKPHIACGKLMAPNDAFALRFKTEGTSPGRSSSTPSPPPPPPPPPRSSALRLFDCCAGSLHCASSGAIS